MLCPEQTILLYFLSTVAQTFAVGFGLLAAFTSYLSSRLGAELRDAGGIIKKRLGRYRGIDFERNTINTCISAGNYREAIEKARPLALKLSSF